ncbi:hypothetical protein [Metallibacterium sp.]|nr:hypothetical protein [Metallibacterium sp.]
MNTGKTLFAQLMDFLPPDQRRTSVKKRLCAKGGWAAMHSNHFLHRTALR